MNKQRFYLLFILFLIPFESFGLEAINLAEEGFSSNFMTTSEDGTDQDIERSKQLVTSKIPLNEEDYNAIMAIKVLGGRFNIKRHLDAVFYIGATSVNVGIGTLAVLNCINPVIPIPVGWGLGAIGQLGYSVISENYRKRANSYQDAVENISKNYANASLAMMRQLVQNVAKNPYGDPALSIETLQNIAHQIDRIRSFLEDELEIEKNTVNKMLFSLNQMKNLINSPEAIRELEDYLEFNYPPNLFRVITDESLINMLKTEAAEIKNRKIHSLLNEKF